MSVTLKCGCGLTLTVPPGLQAFKCPGCQRVFKRQPVQAAAPKPVPVSVQAPASKKLPPWAWYAIGGLVLVLLSCIGVLTRKPATAPANVQAEDQAAAPATFQATELLRDYQANEAAAGQKYHKKTVRVRGRVNGFLGKAVLLESAPAMTCFGLTRQEVAGLREGDEATVEGRVTLGNRGGVHLTGCKLVK